MRRVLVFVSAVLIGTASAGLFYVHPESTRNCIQDCLDGCSANDTVLVGAGTYHENVIWPVTPGIKLISEFGRDTTVIDGGGTDRVLCIPGGTDTTTVIRGFTITHGYSDLWVGAGIRCDTNASPLIEDNLITGNYTDGSADAHGAGIGASVNASPVIRNNVISHNHAGGSGLVGGGVFCMEGGAPLIIGNRVEHNTASSSGGGIACYGDAGAQVRDNEVAGNTGGSGGGIACLDGSVAVVAGNRVTGNEADTTGGGILAWTNANPVLCHNLVSGNSAQQGSGIGCWVSSSPAVESCEVCGNTGDGIGCAYGSTPTFHHCNIAGNTGYGLRNHDTTVLVVATECWWGHLTGPYHPGLNPGGEGDTVSDGVNFCDWLQEPVTGVEERAEGRGIRDELRIPTVMRARYLARLACRVLDIQGRDVTDRRGQLAPGVYFVHQPTADSRQLTAVRKVVVTE